MSATTWKEPEDGLSEDQVQLLINLGLTKVEDSDSDGDSDGEE